MKFIHTLLYLSIFNISFSQTVSKFIVVDQFGYMPYMKKVAVMRSPQTGYDSLETFTPGSNYAVVNSANGMQVFTASPALFNSGQTDPSSGDKVWWFDFSSVTTPGSYFILDITNNLKSYNFIISDTVYKNVLKAAVRMFFYQRFGCAKEAKYAGVGWADGASHIGPLQDKNCRVYNDKNNPATEHDLSGGWYDAGDLNKYTAWTTSYVIGLLRSYQEFPNVFTDDNNIPESGNGIPDLLDEIKWGMDWLLRMQLLDGSCLSVVGGAPKSPPSLATGQSLYGLPSTNATMSCAAAFALGAKIYRSTGNSALQIYADTLQARAFKAWNWAIANPSILFHSNNAANGSSGILPGDQETDSLGRLVCKISAAVYLFDLTGDVKYRSIFDANFKGLPLFTWYYFVDQYRASQQDILLYYTSIPNATNTNCLMIKNYLTTGFKKTGDYISMIDTDPYRAFIKDYNWGSNAYKSTYSFTFYNIQKYNLDPVNNQKYLDAATDYVHYIHGINPFNMVYLTNMSSYGAESSATTMYHSWFCDGSAKWDQVGKSLYGPAPGYITGGPNQYYKWADCCPSSCGSIANNKLCTSESLLPPLNQPQQKSYKDFNTSWPLDSWEITEPSCGYQTDYIRMLSMVIGSQSLITKVAENSKFNRDYDFILFPNPASDQLTIQESWTQDREIKTVTLTNTLGQIVFTKQIHLSNNSFTLDMSDIPEGVYFVTIKNSTKKILIIK